jgi:YegS/Rv2252/BmrU family lipid kinase
MPTYQVIVNPVAGRGAGARAIPYIEELLRGHGLDFDVVRTAHPQHAIELTQQAIADGYEIVVAVGGDGTVNEVINGLMRSRVAGRGCATLGVLCVGRGNDFAYGVDVPTDLVAGCRALAQGRTRTIDVGHVVGGRYPEGRYFGNGVGIGFDAVVGFEALKLKRLSGFPSYVVAALKTIFLYYHAPLVDLACDDETLTLPTLLVSIMNGKRMGGGFFMAPEGRPDDGQFDLCIAREVSRPQIFRLIPHFMRGTQRTQPAITMRQTRRLVVTAREGTLPAHADGETLCLEGQRLELEILPRQIELIHHLPEERR